MPAITIQRIVSVDIVLLLCFPVLLEESGLCLPHKFQIEGASSLCGVSIISLRNSSIASRTSFDTRVLSVGVSPPKSSIVKVSTSFFGRPTVSPQNLHLIAHTLIGIRQIGQSLILSLGTCESSLITETQPSFYI